MSWQGYIDNLLSSGNVVAAAIAGHDGSVWAKSDGFQISPAELNTITSAFNDPSSCQASGVLINSVKHFLVKAESDTLNIKKGNCGACICKTAQTIIIGTYEDGIQPGNCNTAVSKMMDHLRNSGF